MPAFICAGALGNLLIICLGVIIFSALPFSCLLKLRMYYFDLIFTLIGVNAENFGLIFFVGLVVPNTVGSGLGSYVRSGVGILSGFFVVIILLLKLSITFSVALKITLCCLKETFFQLLFYLD